MANRTKSVRFADGSDVLVGIRVQRCHPQDGSARAGIRRGPILRIVKLTDWRPKDAEPVARAMAVLRDAKTDRAAGTELVWNLRRAPGHQPKKVGEPDTRSVPRVRVRGEGENTMQLKAMVSSIRIGNDLKERLVLRGGEVSTTIRRDLLRLYELLDESRERLRFPAGSLATLAEAWAIAAPPPPHNMLRPMHFVPVLRNACERMNTPEARILCQFVDTWTPLDALAVQDIVERYAPEESAGAHLVAAGLQEAPADSAGGSHRPATGGSSRKLDGTASR